MQKTTYTAIILVALLGCELDQEFDDDFGSSVQPVISSHALEDQGQSPWVVELSFNPGGAKFCHGVLIHPNWVLTAGHCVDTEFDNSFRLKMPANGGPNQQTRTLGTQPLTTKIHIHPDFSYSGIGFAYADIALLRVDNAFLITKDVQSVGIPDSTLAIGRTVKLASSLLHEASPPHGPSNAPEGQLGTWLGSISGYLSDNEKLTATSLNDAVRPGDSGSGLITIEVSPEGTRKAVVTGVLSSLAPLSPNELTATNVDFYKTWMLAEMALSETEVDGNVRMTRTNLQSQDGVMQIDCHNQLQQPVSAEGPLDVDGAELRLYCYNTEVESTCDLEGQAISREIGGFSQVIHHSGLEYALSYMKDFAYYNSGLDSFGVNDQSFRCQINLPPAIVMAIL